MSTGFLAHLKPVDRFRLSGPKMSTGLFQAYKSCRHVHTINRNLQIFPESGDAKNSGNAQLTEDFQQLRQPVVHLGMNHCF